MNLQHPGCTQARMCTVLKTLASGAIGQKACEAEVPCCVQVCPSEADRQEASESCLPHQTRWRGKMALMQAQQLKQLMFDSKTGY